MQAITVEMPPVARCAAARCAYNASGKCRAKAITVGDETRAGCDTYFPAQRHSHEKERVAGVGACKAADCRFNRDFECSADSVEVGWQDGQVDCLTYEGRA